METVKQITEKVDLASVARSIKQYKKLAIKYDNTVTGVCHVDCFCGEQVMLAGEINFCKCGLGVEKNGWITRYPNEVSK